jgi:hypothetical protein
MSAELPGAGRNGTVGSLSLIEVLIQQIAILPGRK